MKREIVIVLTLLLAFMLVGCTNISIEKPDTVTVSVQTLGSTKLTDMTYERDDQGIIVKVGAYSSTPTGIPEVIESTGKAITAVSTAGVSSAVETVISTETPITPPD